MLLDKLAFTENKYEELSVKIVRSFYNGKPKRMEKAL